MPSVRAALPLAAVLLFACKSDPPAANEQAANEQAEAKAEAPTEQAEAKAEAEAKSEAGSTELTAEELALIEADPTTLTPEQNRKRGYALRKKIMQDPDSGAAQALEEAKQAALAGQVEVPGQEPKRPVDNGVVIPAPDHLKNRDQSYGKPDTE